MAKSDITGKRKLLARNVSHSNIKTKRWQHINIQSRRLWVPELGRFVRLDVTTRDLRTIDKIGLVAYAKQHGLKLLPPRQVTPHPALSPGAPRLAERSPGQRGPSPSHQVFPVRCQAGRRAARIVPARCVSPIAVPCASNAASSSSLNCSAVVPPI